MTNTEYRIFVETLAALLPGEWTAQPAQYGGDERLALVNSAGARVNVIDGDTQTRFASPGKWTFATSIDRDLRRQVRGWPNDINVAKSKKPATIAKEVQRRLLERFFEVYAKAVADKAKDAVRLTQMAEIVDALGPSVGATVGMTGYHGTTPEVCSRTVQAEMHGLEEIQMTLTVPNERAVELAELLGRFYSQRSGAAVVAA